MINGPVIYLDGYMINRISYETIEDDKTETLSTEPQVSYSFGLSDDNKNGLVTIEANVFDKKRARKIEISVSGNFSIPDNGLDVEDIKTYLAQNGSAILYPYVRSIVSVLTTLDGPSAIVMPTLNMVEQFESDEENSEE